jgi:hypothetical protein
LEDIGEGGQKRRRAGQEPGRLHRWSKARTSCREHLAKCREPVAAKPENRALERKPLTGTINPTRTLEFIGIINFYLTIPKLFDILIVH